MTDCAFAVAVGDDDEQKRGWRRESLWLGATVK